MEDGYLLVVVLGDDWAFGLGGVGWLFVIAAVGGIGGGLGGGRRSDFMFTFCDWTGDGGAFAACVVCELVFVGDFGGVGGATRCLAGGVWVGVDIGCVVFGWAYSGMDLFDDGAWVLAGMGGFEFGEAWGMAAWDLDVGGGNGGGLFGDGVIGD
jgi:hypothetical protein